MKILTFTTLFPNAAQPIHGIFVETRLRHLLAAGRLSATVLAPVPWFPFTGPLFGTYAAHARAPRQARRHGIEIHHPRYPVLPKIGMNLAPSLLYHAVRPALARLVRQGLEFDLIDAHYFYPDGVAAVRLGRAFGKPVTITARGTDLNLIADLPGPGRQIAQAAARADGLITVCQALKDKLVELGTEAGRVVVLRNGVDLELFRPTDRTAARQALAVADADQVLASVGHLIGRKGHDLVIDALPALPDATLLVAGEGPERTNLERRAAALGVAGRVRLLGRIDHDRLRQVYNAADLLVLASSREGWANVLLEAMACGTPVVASKIWGTPEVVASPAAGLLMAAREPAALADAVRRLLARPPARAATRRYAEGFDWRATTTGQIELFAELLARPRPGLAPPVRQIAHCGRH